jgi:hypothetical protein
MAIFASASELRRSSKLIECGVGERAAVFWVWALSFFSGFFDLNFWVFVWVFGFVFFFRSIFCLLSVLALSQTSTISIQL